MPIVNRIADFHPELTAWRQELHQSPELLFDTVRTAAFVSEKLREFGCDIVEGGWAQNGVVAIIRGAGQSQRVIGLRTDMDALPLQELTGLDYASGTSGMMHACGHDGHMSMMLGAARYLAETRNFDGTAVLIFQPAEEGGGGGEVMVKEGLIEKFGVQEVFALHNMPNLEIGKIAMRSGATMAAADRFQIVITGRGGHAAKPDEVIDPVVITSQLINQFQTVASRSVDPQESIVVSVTHIHTGDQSYNVIPDSVFVMGTMRSLSDKVRKLGRERLEQICAGIGAAYGAEIKFTFLEGYPITVNNPMSVEFAADVAREIVGDDAVDTDCAPMMAGEDFSYMLEKCPGAYIFVGNGESAGLHSPYYNFNDEGIPTGASLLVRLVEKRLQK